MHVTDAAYSTVHDYPGGAGSLAPRIGTSQAVLNSKVNPNTTTHHLTLAEAVKLMVLTGDKRILHAIALQTGDVVIEGAAAADACEMAILGSLTGLFARTGQVGTAVHGALEDGRITERECRDIEREVYKLRAKSLQLVRKLQSLQMRGPEHG